MIMVVIKICAGVHALNIRVTKIMKRIWEKESLHRGVLQHQNRRDISCTSACTRMNVHHVGAAWVHVIHHTHKYMMFFQRFFLKRKTYHHTHEFDHIVNKSKQKELPYVNKFPNNIFLNKQKFTNTFLFVH